MRFWKCGLVAYWYAPRAEEVNGSLATIWANCVRLGIDAPIEALAVPTELPGGDRGGEFAVLAAARRDEPNSAYQAFFFVKHDVAGIVCSLSPNAERDDLATWKRLVAERRLLEERADPGDGLLGSATVFVALTEHADGEAVAAERDAAVRHGVEAAGGRVSEPVVTASGVVLYAGSASRARTIAAVASPADEPALDHLTWWDPARAGLDLAPLGSYLVHATKLHYEHHVFQREIGSLRERGRRVDAAIQGLLGLTGGAGGGSVAELVDAQARLNREQAESTGLLIGLTRLRELRQTVSIAARNLELLAPASTAGWPGPFAGDAQTGAWLVDQISHEIAYCEAIRERAAGVQAVTEMRLQQASIEAARIQGRLSLAQSSLIGAFLAGLALLQALDITVGVRESLEAPLAAVSVAFALALPGLIVHWHDGYGRFNLACTAVAGAAAAWLAIELCWRHGPLWAWTAALVLGAATGLLLPWALQLRRRRPSPAGSPACRRP